MQMTTAPHQLRQLINIELETVSDARIVKFIREGLIEPTEVMRNWDYGDLGQQYPCWTVYEHLPTNSGIAYCDNGFGPKNPWGLVSPIEDNPSIGIDAGWYPNFLAAFFEGFAVTTLPIWRVYETDTKKIRRALSDESDWDSTWDKVMALRKANKAFRYDCEHGIKYGL